MFRGLKPVNWCFDCGSALAEAEVEYADRVDPAVDVAFPFADRPSLAKAFGLDSVDDGAIVIWTTTPWTIPSNQALNLHPEIEYALVRVSPAPVSGPLLLIAKDRVEDCLKQWQLEGDVIATAPGAALSGIRFRHPLAKANPVMTARRPSTWATTSRPIRAPAWSTRRRPTASRTSCRARRTA